MSNEHVHPIFREILEGFAPHVGERTGPGQFDELGRPKHEESSERQGGAASTGSDESHE